ncbi:hypothetical protein RhiirA5_412261 [Rhizophagus irregularis]|uniref:NrS-1 polymerase-like helicase domain-containing protein n=1 Tax=Rhizophagus irregularis TaxID=588596 RepID=A0A2N0PZ60_9GLOM|nr:hypothetical protein RhiirA5_412261 [Rhizophagus irregularis]
MTQSDFFEDAPSLPSPYKQGFKASDIGECFYKIRDDSVRPREFLGVDNEDEIEAILSEREGHSLHEFIDGDEAFRPIIDFDLSQEVLDTIEPKLTRKEVLDSLIFAFRKTCLEIFLKWNYKTLTIASSGDAKKMSLYISTFGMRLPNIARVAVFTELVHKKLPTALQGNSIIDNIANKRSFSLRMLGSPKFDKKTGEHVRVKKPVHPKDGTLFDFMIRPPNDESKVIKSSLLDILKAEMEEYPSINNVTTDAEFELVETLLQEASIEGYNLSYPSDNFPDKFPLSRISPSYCPLCDREHTSDNAYIRRNKKSYSFFCYRANQDKQPGTRNPSLKLSINKTALDREKKLLGPTKLDQSRISDPNDCFVWGDLIDMCTSGQKFSRSEIYEAIQATVACIQTTSRLWVLKIEDTNGGLYFDMAPKLDLANNENEKLHEYLWNWWAYLVQKPEKKPRSILVLKSILQQCGKNIITDFIGDKVLGEYLHYATSDLEKILGRFNSAIQARKLIVMNETGMSSGEWHKFNGHLKSLITEGMVSIERKGIETKRIRDFTGFMAIQSILSD